MEGEDLTLRASDGTPLAATLFRPGGNGAEAATVVLVAPATGVPRRFYARFAAFLADRGLPTLSFDYRGVGGSRPARLAGYAASVRDWGERDLAAGLVFLGERFPGARLAVVGHSIGGLLAGVAPGNERVERMLAIGVQGAYWRDWAPRWRLPMLLLWHLVLPVATRLCGYFPARCLGLGEDLPAGVAREWAGRARHPDFLASLGAEDRRSSLLRLSARVLALRFTDDPFATRRAVDRLLADLPNVVATRREIAPADLGLARVGHLGFFREPAGAMLWQAAADWLEAERPDERAFPGRSW